MTTIAAEKRIMEMVTATKSLVISRCIDKTRIYQEIAGIMKQRSSQTKSINFLATFFKNKIDQGHMEVGSEYYANLYFRSVGDYPESGEAPAYRELMEYKSAIRFPRLLSNYNYIQTFKSRFPKTAENIRHSIDPKMSPDPLWQRLIEFNKQEISREMLSWQKEKGAIETAQRDMTAFEVYAFNARISKFNEKRDLRLLRTYDLRDAMEVEQIKLIAKEKLKSVAAQEIRTRKLQEFLLDVKCRLSTFRPSITSYGEILKKDLKLRSTRFEDIISEGVQKILDEIYPSAQYYFTPLGKIKYASALNTMEQVPWPNADQMDNGFRMAMGWGTLEYAKKRYEELANLYDELHRRNAEYLGRGDIDIRKGYWRLYIKDKRPSFPYVGHFIKMKDSKKEFFSETEKEGFMEIEGLGWINFAKAPAPIILGIDMEIDYKTKILQERQYHQKLQEKIWEEKRRRSLIGRLESIVTSVSHLFGTVIKYLNPIGITTRIYTSNPITRHVYKELDKLSGSTLSGLNRVVQLPARTLRGEPISKEDIMEAVEFGLKAGVLAVSGGSAGALIGVAAGQLKKAVPRAV